MGGGSGRGKARPPPHSRKSFCEGAAPSAPRVCRVSSSPHSFAGVTSYREAPQSGPGPG